MKYVIILIWLAESVYVPFDQTLGCYDQGMEIMESMATYQYEEENPLTSQGWYTPKGKLIYGFYCQ